MNPDEIKPHQKRWLILSLYGACCLICTMQWFQYFALINFVKEFYEFDYSHYSWYLQIFYIYLIFFCIPAGCIIDKIGLRLTMLITIICIAISSLGNLLLVYGISFNLFLFGQVLAAVFHSIIILIPPKLSGVWFGEKQVPISTGLGICFYQFGRSNGYVINYIISSSSNGATIIYSLPYIYLIISVTLIPLLYFFFDNAPPSPPSISQLKVQEYIKKNEGILKNFKNNLCNKPFLIFMVIDGIYLALSYALNTTLLSLIFMDNSLSNSGIYTTIYGLTFAEIIGSFLGGCILSKFIKYKEIVLIVFFACFLTTGVFFLALNQGLTLLFIFGMLSRASFGCVATIGFEVGVELTHPAPESTTTGILYFNTQLIGTIFMYLEPDLINWNDWLSTFLILNVLLIAWILLIFVQFNMKRQAARIKPTVEPVLT